MAAFDDGALMLAIGIVGTGWWGSELAKAAHELREAFAIAGFFSLSEQQCRALSARYGGAVFGSLEAVLDEPIDAVILATPHSQHAAQAERAAAAGKHVFVEKPLALTAESARRAVQACEANGRVLGVGHNRRFTGAARRMKEWIDGGRLGRVLHVEANYSGNMAMRLPREHWRSQRAEMPGAGIAPMGLHMIDTLQWLLGPIARVSAIVKRQAEWKSGADLDDTCAALFELEGGATGTLASLLACPLTADLRLYGTAANLEARNNFAQLRLLPGEEENFSPDRSLKHELAAFAEACEGRAPYPVTPAEAVRNVAVMQAIQESADAGGAWISPASL